MPLVLKDGTKVGPVTLICATVIALGVIGAFVYLVQLEPQNSAWYLKALIPVATNIATALFIWVRVHQTSAQVTKAATQLEVTQAEVVGTKEAVETTGQAIGEKLNGGLDSRIENAVQKVLEATNSTVVVTDSPVSAPVTPGNQV